MGGVLSLTASTSSNNSTLHYSSVDVVNDTIDSAAVDNPEFDTAENPFNLVPAADDNDDQVAQLEYSRPGTSLLQPASATSVMMQIDNTGLPTGTACLISGHALGNGGKPFIIGPIGP